MMADKLLPCPFCGGDAEVFHSSDCEEDEEYSIYCGKCYCSTEKVCTYGEAVNLWNNRPSNWHTGTPTEEGWYLLKVKSDDEIIFDTNRLIQCLWGLEWKYANEEILEWQKIKEGEE